MNLRTFLDRACAARGDALFLGFRGRTWSYQDLAAITDGAASAWARLGLRRGDRAAMVLPNGPDLVFTWLALAKLGVVTVPLHPQLTAAEAERCLAHADPAALIRDAALEAGRASPPPGCRLVVERGEALEEILACRETLAGAPAPRPEDAADILMTSGTTGEPKGVVQTQRTYTLTGEGFAHWLGLVPDDRLFTCLPFSHINARAYSTMGAIAAGASLILEERFSASRFWSWIAACRATEFNAIGAMLNILSQTPASPADRAHAVRLVYSAPALGELAHLEFERRFGVRLVIGYGLTESTYGFIHPLEGERRLNTMGKPRHHPDPKVACEVKLIDGSGREADEGEILLRNPAVFAGYFRDKAATREALAPDGWLRTGDIARREEGDWYSFVARRKEVIRRRGENIAPVEVESALMSHPSVKEAAVVGCPSDLGEEDVAAFVVLRPGVAAGPEEMEQLRAHAAARLAAFKVPTVWRFLDELPRTPTQRIAKHLLKPD